MTEGFVDDPQASIEVGIYYPIKTHVFQSLAVYEHKNRRLVVNPTSRWTKREQPQDACDLPVLKLDLELA